MQSSGSLMLSPVAEALTLIDVALVNNTLHSNPAALRRSFQLLVDHIQYQSVQLSRVEEILAAYGNPTPGASGNTVWSKLSAKADLTRLEALESQVDEALNEISSAKSKQAEGSIRHDHLQHNIDLLKDQLMVYEQKLFGGPGGPLVSANESWDTSGAVSTPARGQSLISRPPRATLTSTGGSGGPGSFLERMQRLERRVEGLGSTCARVEEEVGHASQKIRDSEVKQDSQHVQLRGDIKQALAISSTQMKQEAEAEASARVLQSEKKVLARIQSVEEQLDSKTSAMASKVGTLLSSELDKRFQSLYDHIDNQVNSVRSDLDRLSREKVDMAALEAYTSRVTKLFEQVSSTLSDDTRAVSEQLAEKMGQTRLESQSLAANKADKKAVEALEEAMAREETAMKLLAGQVREMMQNIHESLSTQPKVVEDLKRSLEKQQERQQEDLVQVHRSIAGLNSAITSTGTALEAQAQKASSLTQKLSQASSELSSLKAALYGSSCAPNQAYPVSYLETSVMGKITGLEKHLTEMEAQLSARATSSELMESERKLALLQRQAEGLTEGLKNINAGTVRRIEEHASAIQRLTVAVTSNTEDRPTTAAVRNMIETASSESYGSLSSALTPVWDAVKTSQGSLRELHSDMKSVTKEIATLCNQQSDLRTRLSGEKGALVTLVQRAVDEEIGQLVRGQMETRILSLEESAQHCRAQLEVHAQLQDRQHALTSAVESQVSNQLAATRAASAALRTELMNKVEETKALLSKRLDVLDVVTKQQGEDVHSTKDQLHAKVGLTECKMIVEAGAKAAAKEAIDKHKEKEEARWNVWMAQFSGTLEGLCPRAELDASLVVLRKDILKAAEASYAPRIDEALSRASAARALASDLSDQSKKEIDRLRSETVEGVLRVREEGMESVAALEQRAAEELVEAEMRLVRRMEVDVDRLLSRVEFEEEMSKKLDVRVFLASSASASATAAASLLGVSKQIPGSHSQSPMKASRQHDVQERDLDQGGEDEAFSRMLAKSEALAKRVRDRRNI